MRPSVKKRSECIVGQDGDGATDAPERYSVEVE